MVSGHACGRLSDVVIDRASAAGARLALLPCCHDFDACDAGSLEGWLDRSLAIDVTRVTRLQSRGYRVWTQSIPPEITPKNRLLLAEPLRRIRRLRILHLRGTIGSANAPPRSSS